MITCIIIWSVIGVLFGGGTLMKLSELDKRVEKLEERVK